MAECPRCGDTAATSRECKACGWKSRTRKDLDQKPEREVIPCAHETCSEGASARVKTAQGWANFCETHYAAFHTQLAANSMRQRGLSRREGESPAAYRTRLFAWMRENARLKTFDDATRAEDEWSNSTAA